MLTACYLLAGQAGNCQDLNKIQINIHLKNSTLKKALHEMEGLATISFTYKTDDITSYKNINLQKDNASLSAVLDELLKNTDLRYEQVNANIIIKKRKEIKGYSGSPWESSGNRD